MFCHKCGAKAIEGAEFCQKCGAKLIIDTPVTQSVTESSTKSTYQSSNISTGIPKKKKSKKLPIILGILALAVLAIAFIALNWKGKTNYQAAVRAYTPYASSQGMPYTCGEVFDQYIPNAEWNVRESDGVAYVEISGIANGTDRELSVTVQVEAEEDIAIIKSVSVALDGEELSEDAFFALFVAYDEKDTNLSNIGALISEVDLALHGSELLGSFSDEATGISFCYPDWWAELETTGEYEIVDMISPRNSGNHITTFKVSMTFDVLNVFSGDETAVKNSLGDDCTLLNYGDIMLGDVPAKALTYQTKGLNGNDDIAVTFWYMIGEDVYRVACSYAASTSTIYEPIFQAIMESYTVENAVGNSVGPVSSMEEAQRLVENWIADHPMGGTPSISEAAANDAVSVSTEYFVFELWLGPREYAGLVIVQKSNGHMTFQTVASTERIDLDDWYEEKYGRDNTSIELCYKGIPFTDLIGASADYAYDVFGWPNYGTMIDGDLYEGGEYFAYGDGIVFVMAYQTNLIGGITGPTTAIEIDGVALDKNRSELIEMFGMPESEDGVYDMMYEKYVYFMIFDLGGIGIRFEMNGPDDKAYTFIAS